MMRDGAVTHTRAVELARMVLRENARALYGILNCDREIRCAGKPAR
jgi:hypothetical protein